MPIPLGVLAVAGAGAAGAAGAYELLESQILSGTAASITFSNLNSTYGSTYEHLQIRYVARISQADTVSLFSMRLNADTGSNYARHSLIASYVGGVFALRSTATTSQTSIPEIGVTSGNNSTANAFGAGIIDLLDCFSSSKNTTVRGFSGQLHSGDERITVNSGLWNNTAALTTIQLFPTYSGNFVANSRISLYGLRSA